MSFTAFEHKYHQYPFPSGFIIEDDLGEVYKFGQTDAEESNQYDIGGNIVGFNLVKGGNLDYWGLVVSKESSDTKAEPAKAVIEFRTNPDKKVKAPCPPPITHRIPIGGNSWVYNGKGGTISSRNGLRNWSRFAENVTTYFRTWQSSQIVDIELEGEIDGTSEILVKFAGQEKSVIISNHSPKFLGQWTIESPGY